MHNRMTAHSLVGELFSVSTQLRVSIVCGVNIVFRDFSFFQIFHNLLMYKG